MRKILVWAMLLAIVSASAWAISLCDYTQPVTSITTSSLQGNFRYLDDQYRDDRGDVLSLTLAGSFLRYYDSADFGYGINKSGSISYADGSWSLSGAGSVDFRFYAPGMDVFAFGRVNAQAAGLVTPTVAAVVGVGYGRLKDVTPWPRPSVLVINFWRRRSSPRPFPTGSSWPWLKRSGSARSTLPWMSSW